MDKKNFPFVSLAGLISDVAWQVSKEGHEVRYFIGDKKKRDKPSEEQSRSFSLRRRSVLLTLVLLRAARENESLHWYSAGNTSHGFLSLFLPVS
jgi:hypothetical protein